MKTFWNIALSVVCGLLGVGIIFLITRPPRGQVVVLLPPPTPPPLVVYISGAVMQPGVYPLPQGSRVTDALEAAGGLSSEADDRDLNLATLLNDGEHLAIPTQAPSPALGAAVFTPDSSEPPSRRPLLVSTPAATLPDLININTATLEELDSLPDIGPAIAQRIIDYRKAHGDFIDIEDIMDVSGIGPATFEKIKDRITVGS